MTPPSESVCGRGHIDPITRAAQRLADQFGVDTDTKSPTLPEISSHFGLTDADAAEAILLAGNFSICRRAFG